MYGDPNIAIQAVAEARELARDLAGTRRALKRDWSRMGGVEADLDELLKCPAVGPLALAEYPTTIRIGVVSIWRLQRQRSKLLASPEARAVIELALDERARALRVAISVSKREEEAEVGNQTAEILLANAAQAGRTLTSGERDVLFASRVSQNEFLEEEMPRDSSRHFTEDVVEMLGEMRVREARRQLRNGLLLTGQMRTLIRAALPALHAGAPILLVGETGGAKTALAEHLALRTGKTAEFVSGYGDISAAQLVGTHELRVEAGATVTAFEQGPLLRAMSEGRPLILDEVNAMPPEFLKRLNRILQLRPGAVFAVQEKAGLTIKIAQGFSIIATANEHAPQRYRGIEPLSSELVNRFGANIYRVRYPDAGRKYTDYPQDNALLAAAALADDSGKLPSGITKEHLEQVARAAFMSQQIFSGNHGEGFDQYLTTDRDYDQQPGLEETVIAPRTLVAILERVALEGTAEAFHAALTRFVDGVMHRNDREVLAMILESQGIGQ